MNGAGVVALRRAHEGQVFDARNVIRIRAVQPTARVRVGVERQHAAVGLGQIGHEAGAGLTDAVHRGVAVLRLEVAAERVQTLDVQDGARRAEGDGGRERDSPDPALGAGVLEEPDLRVAAVGRGEAPVPPGTPQADDHERAADHEGQ